MSNNLVNTVQIRIAGVVIATILGVLAIVVASHTTLPVMMLAIIFGLILHKTYTVPPLQPGIDWSAKHLLLIGVALLGLKIDTSVILTGGLKLPFIALSTLGATLIFGYFVSRWLGVNRLLGILMAGAVAICGASAAAAICCILPACKNRNKELTLTIAGITVLSTVAMLLYPIIAHLIGFDDVNGGAFMGASIHNVSQTVGAGYSLSETSGDVATVVKLIRVSALLPVILVIGLIFGKQGDDTKRSWQTYFPPFLIAFFALALANHFGVLPSKVSGMGAIVSEWCLIISLVAIGLRTNMREIIDMGYRPMLAMTLTTIFMASFAIAIIILLSP